MSVRLFLAPAGSGKTAWVLDRARAATRRLEGLAYVCVASRLQVRACRRRLAERGGGMGVHVVTCEGLAAACLEATRTSYAELDEVVQHRLLRWAVEWSDLPYYGGLASSPGFIQLLWRLIQELTSAAVTPECLERALQGTEPRLAELGRIYRAYWEGARALGGADRLALIPMARDAIRRAPDGVLSDWLLLAFDGFDSLTPAQLDLMQVLAPRVPEMVVMLTGDVVPATPLVWRRFRRTQQDVERVLGIRAEPFPATFDPGQRPLASLEPALRDGGRAPAAHCAGVELLEAPDRASEVREALRWLKERLVHDGLRPGDVALLARDLDAYRPYMLQIAAEMGLPLRVAGGVPLSGVPVIAAILDLLRLTLPAERDGAGPALPYRLLVEAWRSPYFDWQALLSDDGGPPDTSDGPSGGAESGATGGGELAGAPIDGAAVASALDAVARAGRVIGGWDQWEEALCRRAAARPDEDAERDDGFDGGDGLAHAPVGAEAARLLELLRRFVARVTPPTAASTMRKYVAWLEALIGTDEAPEMGASRASPPAAAADDEARCDGIVACIRAWLAETAAADVDGAPDREAVRVAARDIEALRALKDVLRGLVAAEALLAEVGRIEEPISHETFLAELAGALEAICLNMPAPIDQEDILAADVVAARGLSFRAVALLGLAEGEFPASLGENVLLRDADRLMLRAKAITLELPTESAEPERFYEAVTRASERLLVTRPRLADNGAAWAPSPFWEELRRLTGAVPRALTSESVPLPTHAASWPEAFASLAAHPRADLGAWLRDERPERWAAFASAVRVIRARTGGAPASAYDGDLRILADEFAWQYGPRHVWSPTCLEAYHTCPLMFFVGSVLRLEPRAEPVEGLDGRQLGTIYHRLFEAYYGDGGADGDLDAWIAAVAEPILDEAPRRDGFRETAWWPQTKAEIVGNLVRSINALAACSDGYTELLCEQAFGGDRALVVRDGDDALRVRGLIDRVDRRPDGGVRVIDYKTAGASGFDNRAVQQGRRLQLPLYALAARDALGLGEPVDGFYWHVRDVAPSTFTLARFDGGPEAAFAAAIAAAWRAVRAVRSADFVPRPAQGRCPSYCPAAAFCWHYRPEYR